MLRPVKRSGEALAVVCLVLTGSSSSLLAESAPGFLEIIVDQSAPSAERVAAENVYALDTGMTAIYADSLARYRQQMRDRVPVIFAQFNDRGGQMTLLLPGRDPIVAPPVPEIYVLAKSVAHTSIAPSTGTRRDLSSHPYSDVTPKPGLNFLSARPTCQNDSYRRCGKRGLSFPSSP